MFEPWAGSLCCVLGQDTLTILTVPQLNANTALSVQMSRLLNCCGRRKKTLLDLKDSMLGPFMLLALRGDSSFIQVSGIICFPDSCSLSKPFAALL